MLLIILILSFAILLNYRKKYHKAFFEKVSKWKALGSFSVVFSISMLIIFIFYRDYKLLLYFQPYFFYLYNVGFLYYNSEGLKILDEELNPDGKTSYSEIKRRKIIKNINYVKIISAGLHLMSIVLGLSFTLDGWSIKLPTYVCGYSLGLSSSTLALVPSGSLKYS